MAAAVLSLLVPGSAAWSETETVPADDGGLTASEVDVEGDAAPAVAARLLTDAAIDPGYGAGRDRGNHIAEVAHHMGPGTDFDGAVADDLVAYECAVAMFLRSKDGPAQVSQDACATVPGPPTALNVTPGDGQLAVTWQAPATDGPETCTDACGAPVTSYTVTLEPADAGPYTVTADDDLSVLADGLTNNTEYTVSVVATNRIGSSVAVTDAGTPQRDELAFTAISAGYGYTCAIVDGVAYCWGSGGFGQLGNGDTSNQSRPVVVATDGGSALPADATVTAIAAGDGHTCAIADGAAYCWGHGDFGGLGNGGTSDQTRPVAVATDGGSALPADATVTAISARYHTCVIADGAAYCWGAGGSGRLGNGGTSNESRPVAVATDGGSALPADATVTAISATGNHTCAIADGVAYCWGSGGFGRLGNGGTSNESRPVAVATDSGSALPADAAVTAISAGATFTCAVADGSAYCWGRGDLGQLGNGDPSVQTRPVAVATDGDSALPADATVTAISAGASHMCAIADGAAYCWGDGRGWPRLGNGDSGVQTLPVAVATDGDSELPGDATVTAVSAGRDHTCAIADGAAYCWGHGTSGSLGNGGTNSEAQPVAVATPDVS